MKERFGQYQMAKHYQAVERAATGAFARMEDTGMAPDKAAHIAGRFHDWFDRQLERLRPAPEPERGHDAGLGMDR